MWKSLAFTDHSSPLIIRGNKAITPKFKINGTQIELVENDELIINFIMLDRHHTLFTF